MTIPDIQAKLKRVPFRSFIIELENGGQVLIGEESELFFPKQRPELIIAFTNGIQHEFEIDRITRVLEI